MNWFAIQSAGLTGLDPQTILYLAFTSAACLLLALGVDRVWGEPAAAWHPVVWIGYYLGLCGRISTHFQPAAAFLTGAAFWWVGVFCVGAMAWAAQALAFQEIAAVAAGHGLLNVLSSVLLLGVLSWLLKTTLSWRMLRDEALAVEAALKQSIVAGRQRLTMLVSRDTSMLTESEIRESAIESLAENLNDSVIAPVFWFVLLGLPGAAIYRFSNTADAMWGYRGFRAGVHWEWAGKWAAWADDALSWAPARITALLVMLAAGGVPMKKLLAEANKTPSPNSGWPMAAMALALGVSLRKPGVYVLNPSALPPASADTAQAVKFASKALVMALVFAQLAILLGVIFRVFK